MNDIDRLGEDVWKLDSRITALEHEAHTAPYFLVGVKNGKRQHIAWFKTHGQLKFFCKQC